MKLQIYTSAPLAIAFSISYQTPSYHTQSFAITTSPALTALESNLAKLTATFLGKS